MKISLKYKIIVANFVIILFFAIITGLVSIYNIHDLYTLNYNIIGLRIAASILSFTSIASASKLGAFLNSTINLSMFRDLLNSSESLNENYFFKALKNTLTDVVMVFVTNKKGKLLNRFVNKEAARFEFLIKKTTHKKPKTQEEYLEQIAYLIINSPDSIEHPGLYAYILNLKTRNIIIFFSLANMHKAKKRSILKLVVVSIIVFILSFILNMLISSRIISPLKKLKEMMVLVSKTRNFDIRAQINTKDEVEELAQGFNSMLSELKEKEKIKNIFERYVTKQVAEAILNGKIKVNLSGEKRNVSILFSDIRNFTSMSEKLPPESVVAFLNEYFGIMLKYIFKYNGMLDKYVGDAIMAVFGAPESDKKHAVNAVKAALGMKRGLMELNKRRKMRGEPPINIGIGISSGLVVAGNIGAFEKMEYTVIGDEVNLASRLQDLTKTYKQMIIISEKTAVRLEDSFKVTYLSEVQVKGKTRKVKIYTVEDWEERQ